MYVLVYFKCGLLCRTIAILLPSMIMVCFCIRMSDAILNFSGKLLFFFFFLLPFNLWPLNWWHLKSYPHNISFLALEADSTHLWAKSCLSVLQYKASYITNKRWRHGRKWTWQPEFKSWMRLFVFHIALILLEKVCIQLWVNNRAD